MWFKLSEKTGRPVAELMGLRPTGLPLSMNEFMWSVAYEAYHPSGIDRDNFFNGLMMLLVSNCAGSKIKNHQKFMVDFNTGGFLGDLTKEDYKTIKERLKEVKQQQKAGYFNKKREVDGTTS